MDSSEVKREDGILQGAPSYRSKLFTTRYECGNAYIACGNKSYLGFGILDNGERVDIPTLITLSAFVPEAVKMVSNNALESFRRKL